MHMDYKQYLSYVAEFAKNEPYTGPHTTRDQLVTYHRQFYNDSVEYKTTPHCGYMREVDNVVPDYSLKRAYRDKILNLEATQSSVNSSYRSRVDEDEDDDTLGRVASAAIGFGIGAAVSSLFGNDDDSKSGFGGGDSGGGGASGEW